MFNRTAFASLALAATLIGAPVLAQETIKNMPIPAVELESVRNHCDTLAAAERAQMGDAAPGQGDHEENPDAEGGEADNAAGQGNAAGVTELTTADDASKAAEPAVVIDLESLTLDDCTAAGLTPAS